MQDPTLKPKHRPVSGLAAFWVLVGIAINCVAQPSGRVCGINTDYGPYLRSSPILCGIDALTILGQLSYYANSNPSLRDSARLVLASRFSDQGSIPRREGNFLRIFLFVLGMLPASITILTATGIPWTKTWGLLYLADFILVEIVWFLMGDVDPEPPQQLACDTTCQILHTDYFGAACVLVHSICILICASETITIFPLEWMQGALFAWTVAIMGIAAGRFMESVPFLNPEGILEGWYSRIVPLGSSIGFIVGSFIDRPDDGADESFWVFCRAFIIAAILSVMLNALFFRVLARYFYLLTLCLSLCLAIFYFSVLFDSSGTYSPSWEGMLGLGLSS